MASRRCLCLALALLLAPHLALCGVGGGSKGANKVAAAGGGGAKKPSWGYVGSSGPGPEDWAGICAVGRKQSPVDLNEPEYDPDIPR